MVSGGGGAARRLEIRSKGSASTGPEGWHGLCSLASPMRIVSSLVFAFAVVWAVAFTPRAAWAQTTPSVTQILGAVQRCEPPIGSPCNDADNTGNHPHPNGVVVSALNFEDCTADLHYEFQIGIANPSSSYQLEVWAGTQDCSQLANRQTSATAVCWPVTPFTSNALVNPSIIDVRMQDIASGVFTTTHPTTYSQTTDPAVCQAQTQTGATNITLYMFFVDGGSNPIGTVQQYPVSFDTRAGDVQGTITAGIGDTVLIVGIPSTTDPDTQGWNVYCDPPPGSENSSESVAIDAPTNNGLCPAQVPDTGAIGSATDSATDGALDDAQVDSALPPGMAQKDDAGGNACGVSLNEAGIPSPRGCAASSVLVAGGGTTTGTTTTTDEAGNTIFEEASTVATTTEDGGVVVGVTGGTMKIIDPKYICAQGGATSTSINVTNLKDGFYYNIAVAATDAVGNVGPLSNVVCGEPQPVTDFWGEYTNANGKAGGGFCSTESVGVPAGTSGLGVLMVSSMVAMIRRRRRS